MKIKCSILMTIIMLIGSTLFLSSCGGDDKKAEVAAGVPAYMTTVTARFLNAFTGATISKDSITSAVLKQGSSTRYFKTEEKSGADIDDSGNVIFTNVNARMDYIIELTVTGYQVFVSSNQALNKADQGVTVSGGLVVQGKDATRQHYVFTALLVPTADLAATTMTVKSNDGALLLSNTDVVISTSTDSILVQLAEYLDDGTSGSINIWIDDTFPQTCSGSCDNDATGAILFSATTDANGQISVPGNILATGGRYVLTVVDSPFIDFTSNSDKFIEFAAGTASVNVGPIIANSFSVFTIIPYDLRTGSVVTLDSTEVSFFQSSNTATATVNSSGFVEISGAHTNKGFLATIANSGYQTFIQFGATAPNNGDIVGAYLTPNPDSPAMTLEVRSGVNGGLITTGSYVIKAVTTAAFYNDSALAAGLDAQWTGTNNGAPKVSVDSGTITAGTISVSADTMVNGFTYDLFVYGADGYMDNNLSGTFTAGQTASETVYLTPMTNALQIVAVGHINNYGDAVANSRNMTFTFNQPVTLDLDQTLLGTSLNSMIGTYFGIATGTTVITYAYDADTTGNTVCELTWVDAGAGYLEGPFLIGNFNYYTTIADDACQVFAAPATSTLFLDSDLDRIYNYQNIATGGVYDTASPDNTLPDGLNISLDAAGTTLTINFAVAVDDGILDSEVVASGGVNYGGTPTGATDCGPASDQTCYDGSNAVMNESQSLGYDSGDDLVYTFRATSSLFDLIKIRHQGSTNADDWAALDDVGLSAILQTTLAAGATLGAGASEADKMVITEGEEN